MRFDVWKFVSEHDLQSKKFNFDIHLNTQNNDIEKCFCWLNKTKQKEKKKTTE